MDALAHLGLGELKLATDSAEEAAGEFQIARARPALAAAHLGLGNALAMMCRFEQALANDSQALRTVRYSPEAEFASGFVRLRTAASAKPRCVTGGRLPRGLILPPRG